MFFNLINKYGMTVKLNNDRILINKRSIEYFQCAKWLLVQCAIRAW